MVDYQQKGLTTLNENIVYIGKKPVMTYVLAVLSAFKANPEQVIIKARGRSISTAVDVSEVASNNYLPDLTNTVTLGTEKLAGEEGGKLRNVSTIEIKLTKSHVA